MGRRSRSRRIGGGAIAGPWAVHLAVGAAGALGSLAAGRSPLATDGALGLDGAGAVIASLVLGAAVAAATIAATLRLVRGATWASALAADLRPTIDGRDGAGLVALAIAPSVGEELFFRGFLIPLLASFLDLGLGLGAARPVAVVAAAIAFGALHQVRGRGRWAWALSAAAVACALGSVFVVSGSLVGCVVAHAAINAHNLRLVRDLEAPRKPRRLGGLLQDR